MQPATGNFPSGACQISIAAILIGTLVLVDSLLLGASRFGWTTWAVTNRFLGWFVILGYCATGALIVSEGRKEGFRLMLLTFVGAAAAIAGIEAVLVALKSVGFPVSVAAGSVEGFAQNRNAFAFQLLMAMSAAIVLVRGATLRIALLAVIISGFWFAGSRSGWISAAFVVATSLYLGVLTAREICAGNYVGCRRRDRSHIIIVSAKPTGHWISRHTELFAGGGINA